MLKHILMFRLKTEEKGADKIVRTQRLIDALEKLKGQIPEIKVLEVGVNISQSPSSYDLLLHTEFANQDSLERYRQHPAHQKVLKLIQELCAEKIVVDYLA